MGQVGFRRAVPWGSRDGNLPSSFPCEYRGRTLEKQPAKLQTSCFIPSGILSSLLGFVLLFGSSHVDEVAQLKSIRSCKLGALGFLRLITVWIPLTLGGRGQGAFGTVPPSPSVLPPQGAEADFLMGSSEKPVHVSTGSITFVQRQPSTGSFEERTFF